jgi:hypothetical protein
MKKLLLTLAISSFMIIGINQKSFAQQSDTIQYVYCQIVGTSKFMSNKITIEIDFGQFRSIWTDNRLKDPTTGERRVFNGMIDALNYMGDMGWEFVQAYVITVSSGTGYQNVYHYLLKKSKLKIATEDKLAEEGKN